ncbi:dihydroorotate dehydrogenase (NAD+) catalytic subunit [Alkalispirochaeta americana]|uniref:Dihydroorotate dehydrogenase (NAD+) catalytic subunit n=1 Tax=Alkalispirochaeta americana TaxID=159291 RepID=A0A1N6Q8D9_9SPIO|nr:hypothetical protein [Alkalispirochaeta americana]SIQ12923.1 dihydroorotate dehydrogenase (NAD+) catalytic subunit [Alkalispirochaeta americana]
MSPREVPLATVSGVASTNPAMLDWFARNTVVSILTTKSIQVEPNPGNREPILTEPEPGSFGNAVGLRNPGLAETVRELQELAPRRKSWPARCRLNISLAGGSAEEFALLARELAPFADMLELNFSCPHARGSYGAAIGSDPALVREYTAAVCAEAGSVPVYAKLTPDAPDPGRIARAAVEGGARGIVAINTADPQAYREPHSGASILSNPLGGRGGKSGRWIRERARECVAEIRRALGPEVPLIGMGGVETHEDVCALMSLGATAVGVGSVLARYHQRDWPELFRSLAGVPGAELPPGKEAAGMAFTPFTVAHRKDLDDALCEITLEGSLSYRAGQVCFLWLPGVGEKPFSPADADPLRFLVHRRGPFSRALGQVEAGDTVYLRGPYGEGLPRETPRAALLIGAGSGTAVLPALARELADRKVPLRILVGLRRDDTQKPLSETFQAILSGKDDLRIVRDEGEQARVLRDVGREVSSLGGAEGLSCYVVGPEPFMEAAAREAEGAGISPDRVWLSLEQTMLCGVGLCGACQCGGALTCMYGTFVTARQYWEYGECGQYGEYREGASP